MQLYQRFDVDIVPPARTVLKWDSVTGVFLWILRNFSFWNFDEN